MAKLNRINIRTATETSVAGIPCLAIATNFEDVPSLYGLGYHTYCEVEIYDRKGYRATWLEEKMSQDEERRIKRECLNNPVDEDYDEDED